MQTANQGNADGEHLVQLIMQTAEQKLKYHGNRAVNVVKTGQN